MSRRETEVESELEPAADDELLTGAQVEMGMGDEQLSGIH